MRKEVSPRPPLNEKKERIEYYASEDRKGSVRKRRNERSKLFTMVAL